MFGMRGLDPRIISERWIAGHRRSEATPFFRTAMPGHDAWGRIQTLSAEGCAEKAERRRTAAQKAGR
jgi:hypothetical protein